MVVAGCGAASAAVRPVDAPGAGPLLAACTTGAVAVTGEQMPAATLHRGVRLAFTLAPGSIPCTLTGFPAVVTGAGGPLLDALQTPRGYMGGLPAGNDTPPVVVLRPGQAAHAVVEGEAADVRGGNCQVYSDVVVTPPGTTEHRTVQVPLNVCTPQVHPITP
jgi:hypothetical protein